MLHAASALGSLSPRGYSHQQQPLQPHYSNDQHQQAEEQQQQEPAVVINPTALQRANSRTDAIARLRRAASQREMRRTPTPTAPREGSPEEERLLGGSSGEDHENNRAGQVRANALGLLARRGQATEAAAVAASSSLGVVLHDDDHDQAPAAATLQPGSPQTLLSPPSPLGLASSSHSPSPTPSLTRSRSQNKSPLPSLSQLRARILLERGEGGGLSRANTTGGLTGSHGTAGSASAAARAYALEKLLGASAREGAVSPASDGDDETPWPIGVHVRRTSRSSRTAGFYGQAAGSSSAAHDEPAALVDRAMLRRSRTIGGLSAMAEAQRKAAFVQGSTLELPPPGSQRRSSRRFAQGAGMRSSSPPASLRNVHAPISPPAPVITEESSASAATNGEAAVRPPASTTNGVASELTRKPSQRELARTEMMRKLSGRARKVPPPSLAARAMPAPLTLDAVTPVSPALPTAMSEGDLTSSNTVAAQYAVAPASSSGTTTLAAVTAPMLALTPDTGRSFYSNFAPSPSLAVPGTPARTYDVSLMPGATSTRHSVTSTGLSPRYRARALSSSAGSDGYAPSGVSTSAASVARFAAERDRASAADWAERSDAFELEQALLRRGNASNVALGGDESAAETSRRETRAFSDAEAEQAEEEERQVRLMDEALEVERQRLDPDRQAPRSHDDDDDDDDDDRSEITRDDTPELGRILAEWTSEDGGATSSTTSSPLVRPASLHGQGETRGEGRPTSPLSPLERPTFLNAAHASTASIPLALSASHGDEEYEDGREGPLAWTSRQQEGEWPVSVSSQISTARASPSPALSGDGDDEHDDEDDDGNDDEGVIKIPIQALQASLSVSPPRSTSVTPPASPGVNKPVLGRLDLPGSVQRQRGAAALDALLSPLLLAEYGHPLDYSSAATSPTSFIAVSTPGGAAPPPPKMPTRSSSLRGGARGSMASGFSGISGASTVGEMYGHASKHSGDTFGASSSEARGEAPHPESSVRELKSVDEDRRKSVELPSAPVLAAQHVRHGSRGGHERKISTASMGERGVVPPLSYASTRSAFSSASREDRATPLVISAPLGAPRPTHTAKTPSTSSLVLTAPPQPARPNNAQAGYHPPAASSSELAAMYANDKLTPFPGLFQAPESNTSSIVSSNGTPAIPAAAAAPPAKNEPFVPHAMKVHPPPNLAASEGASKSVSRSVSSRTTAQLDQKQAALGKALNAAQAGSADAPVKLTRETSKARMVSPSFFSSLRRKASNLGRSPDPEASKVKDKTFVRERSPKRGGLFDGPAAMLHRRTPSRDLIGAGANGTGSLSANVSSNGHARTLSAVSSRYGQEDSPIQVIGRSSQNADELLQRNLSLTSLTSSGRGAAAAAFNGNVDVSIASTLDAANSNGAINAELAASPPRDARTEASAATSNLAPATAAMLHRYSRILTSPVEATQLAPSVPLTPAQFEKPPRQLIHAAPVLQVVTNSTVKDRFLLLFSDILVIAKPVAPPLPEDGLQPPQTPSSTSRLPSLKWSFSVRNIVELHYAKLSVPSEKRMAQRAHPLMASFVRRFRTNPTEALEGIIAQSGLTADAPTIAKLLHQTPELDRDGLTAYLCDFEQEGRMDVMRAYVETQRLAGVSIESALRTLLLGLRFPTDAEAFEALLVTFARRWTLANRGLIKDSFSAELATNLVLAIVALNDALHSPTPEELEDVQAGKLSLPVTPGLFSDPMPSLSKTAFLAAFRGHDTEMVLSDRTLLRIYSSVRADPISQAMAADEQGPRYAIRLELGSGLPSKLVYGVASEPVRISIPAPDAEFAIRLYGQDLTFEPAVLTFEKSHECSFTITSKSLGPKHAVFVRAGRTARHYVDALPSADEGDGAATLPITATINVERAFMRNCFTISVPGAVHASMHGNNAAAAAKRKYMFSVDDESTRHMWVRAIGERIEASLAARKELSARLAAEREEFARPARPGAASAVAGPASTRRAAETLALHVLRETLIATDEVPVVGTSPSALQRSASSAVPVNRGPPISGRTNLLARTPSDSHVGSSRATGNGAFAQASDLGRNQSISRHYYAGAGRTERELLLNSPPPPPLPAAFARPAQLETHHELQSLQPEAQPSGGNIHGEDLVTTCAQNSLLPLVLSATATATRADEQLQQQQQQQPQQQ